MTTLNEALRQLKQSMQGPDYRTIQTKFTKEDLKEYQAAMKDSSFKGMVARMSTAALQKSMLKMRGTNVQELVASLDKVLQETASRTNKGAFANADIRSVASTLKVVSTLLEKNEQNQELSIIQSTSLMRGLEKLERFVHQTAKGDVTGTREDRLIQEIARQLRENPSSTLNARNLTSVLRGRRTDTLQEHGGGFQRYLNVSPGARNMMYTALGPFGPIAKSIDGLYQEVKGPLKETLAVGFRASGRLLSGGFKMLKKLGSGISGLPGFGGFGGMLGKGLGMLGKGGLVGLAGLAGWELGSWLYEKLPESFKEKLGEALHWLVDILPGKIGDAVASAWKTVKELPGKAYDYVAGKVQAAGSAVSSGFKAASNAIGRMGLPMPSSDVGSAIVGASRQIGVDPGYMMAMARQESSFNPNAQAPAWASDAKGLYQFIGSTWNGMVGKYGQQYGIGKGDIYNPKANATMAALYAKENTEALRAALKREPTPGELYMAHFMGANGAIRFLQARAQNGDADASQLQPAFAKSNPKIYFAQSGRHKTLNEVYDTLTGKINPYIEKYGSAVAEADKITRKPLSSPTSSASFSQSSSPSYNSPASGSGTQLWDIPIVPADGPMILINTPLGG